MEEPPRSQSVQEGGSGREDPGGKVRGDQAMNRTEWVWGIIILVRRLRDCMQLMAVTAGCIYSVWLVSKLRR